MTKGQVVEDLREQLRHLAVVLALHLALEAVHLVHHVAFVVASREVEVLGVQQFEAEQSEDGLHGEGSTINEVAIEQLKCPCCRCNVPSVLT